MKVEKGLKQKRLVLTREYYNYWHRFLRGSRDVQLKRNLFIYSKYFQWFFKCFLTLVDSWRKKSSSPQKIAKDGKNIVLFFLTGKQFSFFNVLAKGLLFSLSGLTCFHFKWDPLFFFYSFQRVRNSMHEFFPVFFLDPNLLNDSMFKQNFFSLFIKYPVFFVLNFYENKKFNDILAYKRLYAFYLPTSYGAYLFLFWLRFMFKLI